MISLVTPDAELIAAAVEDEPKLASMLDAEIAEGWVGFLDALRRLRATLEAAPGVARWSTRFFVLDEPRTLVGWGGFKGPPTKHGVVEVGYEIAPAFRERGLATAAVTAMLDEAWADERVKAVIAHTLAEPGPSVRVLEKAGFSRDGELKDEEDGELWRFRRERG